MSAQLVGRFFFIVIVVFFTNGFSLAEESASPNPTELLNKQILKSIQNASEGATGEIVLDIVRQKFSQTSAGRAWQVSRPTGADLAKIKPRVSINRVLGGGVNSIAPRYEVLEVRENGVCKPLDFPKPSSLPGDCPQSAKLFEVENVEGEGLTSLQLNPPAGEDQRGYVVILNLASLSETERNNYFNDPNYSLSKNSPALVAVPLKFIGFVENGIQVQVGKLAPQVVPLPLETPPNCSLSLKRRQDTSTCDVMVTSTGGSFDKSSSPIFTGMSVSPTGSWTSDTVWSGTGACSLTAPTSLSASIKSPGSQSPVSCAPSPAVEGPYNCYADASGGLESVIQVGSEFFRIHQFKTVGASSLTVKESCPMEVLVVAGGGGGGGGNKMAAGGGAGGVLYNQNLFIPVASYSVSVGAGGAGKTNGTNSSFIGPGINLIAIGGGRGGCGEGTGTGCGLPGASGGSGGGGAIRSTGLRPNGGFGGAGTVGQGNRGGDAKGGNTGAGGGGGGAGGAGGAGYGHSNANMVTGGGAGGVGRLINITGTALHYGGGGGGTGESYSQPGGVSGAGGAGGGGAGATNGGAAGAANTGGGGGGGGNGGAGGSGIVVVRYKISPKAVATCSQFKVTWSPTNHGFCDYTVTGLGSKVILSDGITTYEKTAFSGSIPCSPWNATNGDLSFKASVQSENGNSFSCPLQQLKCNAEVSHLMSGGSGYQSVTVDKNGLKYGSTQYRHWLFILTITTGRVGYDSSVTIGSVSVTRKGNGTTGPTFAGIGLAVGSSGNYTEGSSRYVQLDFYQQSGSYQPGSGKGPQTPALSGNVPIKWSSTSAAADGSGPQLGIYLARCTNNRSEILPPWFTNGYYPSPYNSKSPKTFMDILKP